MPSGDQVSSGRDASVDILRGLAIIAIVFGHVLRGLSAAAIIDPDAGTFIAADRAVYMVHLSVFAFTAGLMVRGSIEKRGARDYARARIGEFLWLYFLWSILQGLVAFALSNFVNNPPPFWTIFALWEPDSQQWFFPWLALMTACVSLLQPWRGRLRAWVTLIASLALSLATWGYFGAFAFTQGLGLSFFYFAAATLTFARYRSLRAALGQWGPVIVFLVGGGGYALLLVTTTAIGPTSDPLGIRSFSTIAAGFVCSWLGVFGAIGLSMLLDNVARLRMLFAYLGEKSLVIFLGHTLAQAGSRIALSALGVEDAGVQLLVGTAVGLGAPILMWKLTRRWAPWLWSLSFRPQRASTRAQDVV